MKKIIILEGGYNEEHEVSLNTSIEVQKSLKRLQLPFEIIKVNPKDFSNKIKSYDKNFLFFNALHGTYGEDGKVQAVLETNGLLYTHSKFNSSKNSFNKSFTKEIIRKTEVPYLMSKIIKKQQIKFEILNDFFSQFNSFVMKPVNSGSSFGVKVFYSLNDINKFFNNYETEIMIYQNHNDIMLEKYIAGRELTVGVFDNNKISESLAVTEIITNNEIYDYDAKYVQGLSEHIIPAKLPKSIYNQCLNYAKIVHNILNCRGISRSDFIYDENNLYFLEINSQPGLTQTSLVPEQLRYKNIDFDKFILEIIESSL